MQRDAEDDSEPGFKSDHNDSNSDDDVDESPSKKAKTNGNAKVKVEAVDDQEENGTFYENVTEIPFGGDGHMEMEEGIYA